MPKYGVKAAFERSGVLYVPAGLKPEDLEKLKAGRADLKVDGSCVITLAEDEATELLDSGSISPLLKHEVLRQIEHHGALYVPREGAEEAPDQVRSAGHGGVIAVNKSGLIDLTERQAQAINGLDEKGRGQPRKTVRLYVPLEAEAEAADEGSEGGKAKGRKKKGKE